MYKSLLTHVMIFFSLVSKNVYADGQNKHFNIGVGSYALSIVSDDVLVKDEHLSGTGFFASYATSDKFSVRAAYYSLTHNDNSSLDDDGIDLQVYFGSGFVNKGSKAFLGGGIYNETWRYSNTDETFSGIQFSGGLGYNWQDFSLDFIIGIRETSDYDDLIDVASIALTGSLMVSARF